MCHIHICKAASNNLEMLDILTVVRGDTAPLFERLS